MSMIQDYPVAWRGRRALAQAVVEESRVRVFSVSVEGVVDRRGQPVVSTFVSQDPGTAGEHATAFSACSPEERDDIYRQIAEQA